MIIKNPSLLAEFRTPGRCECCGRWCNSREPSHTIPRGMGGANRMDLRINLTALGSTPGWQCHCHRDHEDGKPPYKIDLFEIAAKRENTTAHAIDLVLGWVQRLDKNPSPERIKNALARMRGDVAELARRVWQEIEDGRTKSNHSRRSRDRKLPAKTPSVEGDRCVGF